MGPGAKYIGLHLRYVPALNSRFQIYPDDVVRNGLDWVRACDHVTRPGVTALFSSPQCLGYRGERGQLGAELCMPRAETVISQLAEAIRSVGNIEPKTPKKCLSYIFSVFLKINLMGMI